MDPHMQRIALTVERHGTGKYFWVLLDSDGTLYDYRKLVESASMFSSYRGAFEAGLEALWKSAPELDDRENREDRDASFEQISSICHQS
ncbi:hypothetical protein GN316_05290 [Xylophilus sp. Kf1]|nr:hypothetical protein [Xylophilus sp. Kf1]